MPDDPAETPRTLTEHEAYAIAADRVQRDTAALTAQVEKLTTEKADLSSKLDVAEATVATEKAAKETAEKDLATYKAQVEQERQVASRRDARTAKVREVAAHLKDDFFTEERVSRWAQMDDAAFEIYAAEMAALSSGAPNTGSNSGAPRETAMTGSPVAISANGAGNGTKLFELRKGGTS